MNTLTEYQKEKLEALATATNKLGNADISQDMKTYLGSFWTAGQAFRNSLPFTILDEQLERHWTWEAPEPNDWEPQTLLEKDLLILLRNVEYVNSGSSIYQFATNLQNVDELIAMVSQTSDAEYPDDSPQFRGTVEISEGPPM